MLSPFKKFTQIADFFYTAAGIQPYKDLSNPISPRKSRIINVVFLLLITNLDFQATIMSGFVYMAFHTRTNFTDAVVNGACICFIIVANYKMFLMMLKQNNLTRLITELKEMYPTKLEKQEAYKLRTYLRQATIVTILFAILYMLLIWTFNLFALLQYATYKAMSKEIELYLPYNIYVPFDCRGRMCYYLMTLSQFLGGHTATCGNLSSDLLLCAIATQVVMHFDYIKSQIEEFIPRGEKHDLKFLSGMAVYHRKILRLTDQINSIFGVTFLINFGASSFIICFVGFQMTTGVTSEELFKYMLFLVSSLAQVYLICYYGQRITTSSENIADALYNQVWYQSNSNSYKKSLIIMMKRAQKPACLKATSLLTISLATFTEIGQVSYKFFALLRTMYGEE